MTKQEAAKLMAMLVAAYPRGPWPDETRELYESELQQLDSAIAGEAVRRAIRTCKFPPAIAEILELNAEVVSELHRKELAQSEELEWELRRARKHFDMPAASLDEIRALVGPIGRGGVGGPS